MQGTASTCNSPFCVTAEAAAACCTCPTTGTLAAVHGPATTASLAINRKATAASRRTMRVCKDRTIRQIPSTRATVSREAIVNKALTRQTARNRTLVESSPQMVGSPTGSRRQVQDRFVGIGLIARRQTRSCRWRPSPSENKAYPRTRSDAPDPYDRSTLPLLRSTEICRLVREAGRSRSCGQRAPDSRVRTEAD